MCQRSNTTNTTQPKTAQPNTLSAHTARALAETLKTVKSGDTITLTSPLHIDKTIILRAEHTTAKVQLLYTGAANTAAFNLHPKGKLYMQHINIQGNSNNRAFSPLQEHMASAYNVLH
ncbi:hypothetical protein FNB79_11625 [Formosa sediminum]|uniref:Uncharacterized protein n=1 Tax=Formosa sediminum TaxID=2594004 RepID=A0A516GST9_9FLAO|nr:hypothetical protein [Formosa sediminum]QDO94586.1 hypothetical protein FNB79_11625 [Formosa sediminum]